MSYKFMTAAEAASLIKDGDIIGLSGFTPAGTPKAVTAELAKMAEEKHARGEHFKVSVLTGASTGDSCDGVLIRANALDFRAPYTTNSDFRKACNNGQVKYSDIHLSQMAQRIRSGFLGKVNVAIMEACELTADGRIYLTAGVGISPTVARLAEKVIVELNAAHNKTSLMGMHDIYELERPPHRRPIMIEHASDRIGTPYIQVDPAKIAAVVEVNIPDEARGFHDPDPITDKIGQNVADLDLVKTGRIKFGSTCSLSVTNDCLQDIYDNIEFFRDKLVLRPSEISNCPEVVRRLGVISMNTAIEADIYGNVNSTHICGTKMMNGIGGSGDFTRSAYISIFSCPSTAKGGCISSIVPMVSHQDHSEHSVNVIITEQGIADLRGKSPMERAKTVIENCAHPDYKQLLWDYLKIASKGQTSHSLSAALGMHEVFLDKGDMRLTDWADFKK